MKNKYTDDRREPFAAISLVPMVGVVFVLACLFLAAGTPARTYSMSLPLPVLCSEGFMPPTVYEVAIDADGAAWVDGKRRSDAALEAELVGLTAPLADIELRLMPSSDVQHERVIEIIAMAERARIEQIVFYPFDASMIGQPSTRSL